MIQFWDNNRRNTERKIRDQILSGISLGIQMIDCLPKAMAICDS